MPSDFNSTAVLGAGTLLIAGVLITLLQGIKKQQGAHDVKLARIETILTGATGDNGLAGDVKGLREKAHQQGDALHTLRGEMQVYEIRLTEIDRRHGPDDRRAHAS